MLGAATFCLSLLRLIVEMRCRVSMVVRPQDSSLTRLREVCHGDHFLYLHNWAAGGDLDIAFGELVDTPNAVHLLAHPPLQTIVMRDIVHNACRRLGR